MSKHLVVRSSGGMSNRLQAVLAGMAYCLLTGRTLHVDWRDSLYSDDLTSSFPRFFAVEGVEFSPDPFPGPDTGVFPPFWSERLADPVAIEYMFDNNHFDREIVEATCIDFGRLDYPDEVLVGWSPDLRPLGAMLPMLGATFAEFRGLSVQEAGRLLLARHCRVCPEVAEAVEAFKARHFTGPMAGAHIRYTDLRAPLPKFAEALRGLTAEGAGIFLATDNYYVQRSFARLFPGLACTEKFLSRSEEPLHSGTPGVSSVRKGIEALIDMWLLADCGHIVRYDRSSFALIPILLAGHGPDRVTEIAD